MGAGFCGIRLIRLIKSRVKIPAKELIILIAVALALSGAIYVSTLQPILAEDDTAWTKVLSVLYPIGGVILFVATIALFIVLKKTTLGPGWLAFVFAFGTYAVADLVFTYLEAAGTYQTGSFSDILYYAAHLLFAYAFFLQLKPGAQ